MAQVNTTVGDFAGNRNKILELMSCARESGVDLLTFPELAICGYPPEDLLFKPAFIRENLRCLDEIIEQSSGLTLVVGFVDDQDGIYNAAAVIHDKKLAGIYHKIYLPNYGVFDERRYFKQGNGCPVFTIAGVRVGVNVCEDMWFDIGPHTIQARSGAEVIVAISASPYHKGKTHLRILMMANRARSDTAFVVYNNLVGGQDELVFDGTSLVLDPEGQIIAMGKQFEEDFILADLNIGAVKQARSSKPGWQEASLHPEAKRWCKTSTIISKAPSIHDTDKPPIDKRPVNMQSWAEEVYNALVLGTRDYIRKNGFEKVVIGLSGGVDSSLVTAIAADAIGPSSVIGVTMPSRYSSAGSVSDSELLAKNIGIELLKIPIEPVFKAYLDTLSTAFKDTEPNVTEENLQARARGNIIMALSNKFGWLVLTTGNKSEMSTGYATLYGDMAGGFAVIKDVPKTLVYELCRYRNSIAELDIIPPSVINKPPSAELRPDQYDIDSLPPYDVLDPILVAYVEEDRSIQQLIEGGFDEQTVRRVARMVDASEYKRRQAPPGIKITPKAFGRDRRLPITNRFGS